MFAEHPAGLPVPLTSLIGRGREIADVCALLSQEGVRLVTLTEAAALAIRRELV